MATWNSDLSNVMGYCVEASRKTQLESSAEWNPCQPCTLVSYQKSIPKYSQVTLSGWKSKHYAKSAMRWALPHGPSISFLSVGNSRNLNKLRLQPQRPVSRVVCSAAGRGDPPSSGWKHLTSSNTARRFSDLKRSKHETKYIKWYKQIEIRNPKRLKQNKLE